VIDAKFSLEFASELDFLRYASIVLGVVYTNPRDAVDAINRGVNRSCHHAMIAARETK